MQGPADDRDMQETLHTILIAPDMKKKEPRQAWLFHSQHQHRDTVVLMLSPLGICCLDRSVV